MNKETLHSFKVTFYAQGIKHETIFCTPAASVAAAKQKVLSEFTTFNGSPVCLVAVKRLF